jgi:hypothetical protein
LKVDLVEVHLDPLEGPGDVRSDTQVAPFPACPLATQTRDVDLELVELRDFEAEP